MKHIHVLMTLLPRNVTKVFTFCSFLVKKNQNHKNEKDFQAATTPNIHAWVDCQKNKGIMKYLLCSAKSPRAEKFQGLILFEFKRRMKFCRFKVEYDDWLSWKNAC